MFYLQKILGGLILPPTSLLLLIALGLALWRRWPRLALATAWTGVIALFTLSLPVVSTMLVRAATSVDTFSPAAAKDAQAIVILGGGRRAAPEYGGESVSTLALERVRYGAKLARELELPVLVSGGAPYSDAVSEAELMARTLEEFGVRTQWIEGRSRNTHENALYSAEMLRAEGIDRVVLVTHDIHQRRSIAEFTAAGLSVVPAPVTLVKDRERTLPEQLPGAMSLMRSSLALHELIGYFVVAPKR